ncbi:hypothetical protein [Marinobacter similis]|uniref:Uncharacterized protein n=1 Tax=Marinobacter similis TaxID=1420916 RepID=W5YI77_9GAMM|nr:hypothetical protein [Marinobacter similis]AHI28775.1 hypothetical protein AU14_09520 [Marinobacter similis]
MSSRIELPLQPSLAAGLVASASWLAMACFILIAGTSNKGPLLLGLIPTLAGALFQFRSTGLLSTKRAVTALQVLDGQLYAQLGHSRTVAMEIASSSQLAPHLALLKLRPVGTRLFPYSAILLTGNGIVRGNVPEDEFRRLRVWLRLGRSQPNPV